MENYLIECQQRNFVFRTITSFYQGKFEFLDQYDEVIPRNGNKYSDLIEILGVFTFDLLMGSDFYNSWMQLLNEVGRLNIKTEEYMQISKIISDVIERDVLIICDGIFNLTIGLIYPGHSPGFGANRYENINSPFPRPSGVEKQVQDLFCITELNNWPCLKLIVKVLAKKTAEEKDYPNILKIDIAMLSNLIKQKSLNKVKIRRTVRSIYTNYYRIMNYRYSFAESMAKGVELITFFCKNYLIEINRKDLIRELCSVLNEFNFKTIPIDKTFFDRCRHNNKIRIKRELSLLPIKLLRDKNIELRDNKVINLLTFEKMNKKINALEKKYVSLSLIWNTHPYFKNPKVHRVGIPRVNKINFLSIAEQRENSENEEWHLQKSQVEETLNQVNQETLKGVQGCRQMLKQFLN